MGRPERCLSDAQKAEVETLAAVLTAQQVADYFGIGRTTFFAMMERGPEIAERYKRGKAKVIGTIAQGLIAKARSGDTASMIFFLKTQAGWREVAPLEDIDAQVQPARSGDGVKMLHAYLDQIAAREQVVSSLAIEEAHDAGLLLTTDPVLDGESEDAR